MKPRVERMREVARISWEPRAGVGSSLLVHSRQFRSFEVEEGGKGKKTHSRMKKGFKDKTTLSE